jgi:hypothetical protein
VGLLLVENELFLPSFMVKKDQFHRGIEFVIEETRDQNMFLAVSDPLGVV